MIPINEGYNYKSKPLVETAIQDGAYENKEFSIYHRGIQPLIKIIKNSRCRKNTIIT